MMVLGHMMGLSLPKILLWLIFNSLVIELLQFFNGGHVYLEIYG